MEDDRHRLAVVVTGYPTPAERALRTAVIWRRLSLGSQSAAGSEFVARLLTVVTSLRAQGRGS